MVSDSISQHYSLRWNNHQSHVLSAFDSLLQNGCLVDCTLVCEDTSIRAHKVVLSACSPYFQKIFTDNPSKHPIIVLKDVCGWEVRCIIDFMYKGETSVPETQLTSLIKAAESLRVRGLTSSQHSLPGHNKSAVLTVTASTAGSLFCRRPAYSAGSTSSRGGILTSPEYNGRGVRGLSPLGGPNGGCISGAAKCMREDVDEHDEGAETEAEDDVDLHQCGPISLTNHEQIRPCDRHLMSSSPGNGPPRRKQARPRRRSGDSTGNSSSDFGKSDSPPSSSHGCGVLLSLNDFAKNGMMDMDASLTPENLSMKRPDSPPAINLVKTERLMEDFHRSNPVALLAVNVNSDNNISDNTSDGSDRDSGSATSMGSAGAGNDHVKSMMGVSSATSPAVGVGIPHNFRRHEHPSVSLAAAAAAGAVGTGGRYITGGLAPRHEQEARAEAFQALNFMSAGGGLPHFPSPIPPHMVGIPNLTAQSLVGPLGMKPSTTSNSSASSFGNDLLDVTSKQAYEFQRISIDRTKMSEDEAFEHAIEMIQSRQMGFRKAADFFSVSKWKLYKTARKRGIYAEIKKQNLEQQSMAKVPSNVQRFSDLGVYKHIKKKSHLTKDSIFPHLPICEARKQIFSGATITSSNHNNNNNNNISLYHNSHMMEKIKVNLANGLVHQHPKGISPLHIHEAPEGREAEAKQTIKDEIKVNEPHEITNLANYEDRSAIIMHRGIHCGTD